MKADLLALARGGESDHQVTLVCYVDYATQEYVLGNGPAKVTVGYDMGATGLSHELYTEAHGTGMFGDVQHIGEGVYQGNLEEAIGAIESALADLVEGSESVIFASPMGAHFAISVEVWQAIAQWDLQLADDETTVNAVRYGLDAADSEFIQTLANLKSRVTTAAASDDFANDRIANVSGLTQYYRDMGAYGDITPDDGSTATFTPAQPPPTLDCASGTAVTTPADNRALVRGCQALLDAKDSLRGTGSLNWSTGTAISSWDGITTGGTPTRVTRVELDSESLTGTIPSELGSLFELTHLKLNSNSLTGSIPHELGWLYNLEELKLSGNSLTGCIPIALEDVATNDLSSLNLLYCQPPAPESLTSTTTETSITVNWGAVSNTTKYRVEYREALPIDWIVATETLTTTTHSFSDLPCGTSYQFRVSAFGSGTTYDDEWSLPSDILNTSTSECVTPVFDEEDYAFTVSASASIGTIVGTVSATDPNGDAVRYSITDGNTGLKFGIISSTGEILVLDALGSVSSTVSLTVQATDRTNTSTTTVDIAIKGSEATLTSLPDTMVQWDQIWFAAGAAYLDPTQSYELSLTTSHSSLVLHPTTCGHGSLSFTIPADSESFSRTVALHACATSGGTVTATLRSGQTVISTVTHDVTVTTPTEPRLPSIEFQDPPSSIEEGQSGGVRTRAFYLSLTESYSVRVTTDSANIGFNSDCSDRQHDSAIGRGNASGVVAFSLYACTAPGGTITATLLRGATTVDSATFTVTVTEPPPQPSIEISDLSTTLAEGQSDAFEAIASHLTPNSSFFVEVRTSGAGLGFNADCTDRYEELTVERGSASASLPLTLYACETPGGTVTATLVKGARPTDTATLDVTVVDPPEDAPSALENLAVSLTDGTFSLAWDDLTGAAKYEPQYNTEDTNDGWTALPEVTESSTTFGPADGPACGATYRFRVRAFGDATFFTAEWGSPSAEESAATEACNIPPEFDPDTYRFSVAENAATGSAVGTVSVSDDDTDDELSYSITAGNTGDAFDIGEDTGAITVAAALDHETNPSYTLTVEVDDGREGTDTATVTITVNDIAEDAPPAPENLDVSLTGGTFSLSWDALTGAANYEPQYRTGGSNGDWVALPATTSTSTTFSPADGPTCGTTYDFRVRAYGDATKYLAQWGTPSGEESVTTEACNIPPEFDPDSYRFSVAENATVDTAVGSVTASDDDTDDDLSYSITAGNTGDAFDIGEDTGAITVAAALDHETNPSYTLTIEVDDGREGTDTATVTITVTDIAEDAPPAPENLDVSLTNGTFSLSWDDLTGAAKYEPQYNTGDTDDGWTALPEVTESGTTFSPADGPACGTTYRFRVRAYGDATKYLAEWGTPSDEESITTDACNAAPEFAPDSYEFSVAENATADTAVGTVTASDDDTDDDLSYSITAGNIGDAFDIGEDNGTIIVAAALDHETNPSYTLTIEVDDGRAGTDTATITITVTDIAEDAPPAPDNLEVSLTNGTFSLSWDDLTGAANYEPQYRTGGSDSNWVALPTTTSSSTTFSPAGGPACATTYDFRVRAYGDATKYIAQWGTPSGEKSVTTGACNRPPAFQASTYSFPTSATATASTTVGTVIATDPDNDSLSYAIIGGNDQSSFSIGTTSGQITVADTLGAGSPAFHALTVQVSDSRGGLATTRVGIPLLRAECSNGTVVPRPAANPDLVRDCSMLLAARDQLRGEATLNWSSTLAIGDWQGVQLRDGTPSQVQTIILTDSDLTGSIPSALGGLADLQRLDLDDNQLTGSIPSELSHLVDLRILYLSANQLTGALPPELGMLANLRVLYVDNNQLSGTIPVELGQLSNLTHLILDRNSFSGSIPIELGQLTSLEHLFLRDNGLTGEIPSALGALTNLDNLYLEGNTFTGCIPRGLQDITNNDFDTLNLTLCAATDP